MIKAPKYKLAIYIHSNPITAMYFGNIDLVYLENVEPIYSEMHYNYYMVVGSMLINPNRYEMFRDICYDCLPIKCPINFTQEKSKTLQNKLP